MALTGVVHLGCPLFLNLVSIVQVHEIRNLEQTRSASLKDRLRSLLQLHAPKEVLDV